MNTAPQFSPNSFTLVRSCDRATVLPLVLNSLTGGCQQKSAANARIEAPRPPDRQEQFSPPPGAEVTVSPAVGADLQTRPSRLGSELRARALISHTGRLRGNEFSLTTTFGAARLCYRDRIRRSGPGRLPQAEHAYASRSIAGYRAPYLERAHC